MTHAGEHHGTGAASGPGLTDAQLERLQQQSFSYFLHEANLVNGLVADRNAAVSPASIAATGIHDPRRRGGPHARHASLLLDQVAGAGPVTLEIAGVQREFFDYVGRGVPYGPYDGTIAPWAVAAAGEQSSSGNDEMARSGPRRASLA